MSSHDIGPPEASALSRRDVLKLASVALMPRARRATRKVLVAGGGIGGLSCAWELVRRGHDVTVLEAATRTGGHVFTYRESLDDGLYADAGAEHFTNPGYDRYREYVREFDLPYLYYPRREHLVRRIEGRLYTTEMLADPKVLRSFGFNRREVEYLTTHPFPELASLYYRPYLDSFEDEYRPFDAGLNRLDELTTADLFEKDGASAGALKFIGGGGSALQSVWHAAILKIRGVPLFPPKVYRLQGGNQKLPDAFTERLGDRVRLGSPVTRIERGDSGVRVTCREGGRSTTHEADVLVCAMSAVMLRAIPVEPAWPEAKAYAINHVPYYFDSRIVLQSRSKFWATDGVSPNMEIGDPALDHVWSTGSDVDTSRGLIVGTAPGAGDADRALAAFRTHYPGRSEDVEKARAIVWPTDPWASACERVSYAPGQLARFWPTLIEPLGRIHFVGAYADNLNWGMEAATRSANRVAEAIDTAAWE
jgi:monoamine oxidase